MSRILLLFLPLLIAFACASKQENSTEKNNDITEQDSAVISSPGEEPSASEPCAEYLTVGFYNVENLFDTEDDPVVLDEEFLPKREKQWDESRYQDKLNKLAKVIAQLGQDELDPNAADIIGLCEVENKQVVEDLLATAPLAEKGLELIHFNSFDKRGIDVAMIYDPAVFTPETKESIEVDFANIPQRDFQVTLTRSILVVTGKLCGEDYAFLVNHWPSRRGGVEESSPKREWVAKHVREIVDKLEGENPSRKIVLMGDFNDTPFNKSIKEVLKADTTRDALLYNTVGHLQAKGIGSHYYREERSMLDQLIVNQATIEGEGYLYEFYSAKRFAPEWLKQDESNGKFAGYPFRTYVGDRYMGGYSDHFPVFLRLKKY